MRRAEREKIARLALVHPAWERNTLRVGPNASELGGGFRNSER